VSLLLSCEGVMVGALPALHPFSPLLLMLEGVEHTPLTRQYLEYTNRDSLYFGHVLRSKNATS
jgi:hypothetical protein